MENRSEELRALWSAEVVKCSAMAARQDEIRKQIAAMNPDYTDVDGLIAKQQLELQSAALGSLINEQKSAERGAQDEYIRYCEWASTPAGRRNLAHP